jgi:hypothetical protein
LCLRIWDNVLAFGTRFLLSAALAILKLIEQSLLRLNFGEINDFFKQMKDQDERQTGTYRLLPDFELIIRTAKKINITNEKIS